MKVMRLLVGLNSVSGFCRVNSESVNRDSFFSMAKKYARNNAHYVRAQ